MWLQQGVVVNCTVRSTLDNKIHDSHPASIIYSWFIQILTYVCVTHALPEIKTRVVTDSPTDGWMDRRTDGWTYRRTDKVIAVTLRLRFVARVNDQVLFLTTHTYKYTRLPLKE